MQLLVPASSRWFLEPSGLNQRAQQLLYRGGVCTVKPHALATHFQAIERARATSLKHGVRRMAALVDMGAAVSVVAEALRRLAADVGPQQAAELCRPRGSTCCLSCLK